jgi:hypothetical protein
MKHYLTSCHVLHGIPNSGNTNSRFRVRIKFHQPKVAGSITTTLEWLIWLMNDGDFGGASTWITRHGGRNLF